MFGMQRYLNETYPNHADAPFLIEHRDVLTATWMLYGTCSERDQLRRASTAASSPGYLARGIDRELNTVCYPNRHWSEDADSMYSPVRWRGLWRDDQRGQVLDLLRTLDPTFYPADRFLKWTISAPLMKNGLWFARRDLSDQGNSVVIGREPLFGVFLAQIENYYTVRLANQPPLGDLIAERLAVADQQRHNAQGWRVSHVRYWYCGTHVSGVLADPPSLRNVARIKEDGQRPAPPDALFYGYSESELWEQFEQRTVKLGVNVWRWL